MHITSIKVLYIILDAHKIINFFYNTSRCKGLWNLHHEIKLTEAGLPHREIRVDTWRMCFETRDIESVVLSSSPPTKRTTDETQSPPTSPRCATFYRGRRKKNFSSSSRNALHCTRSYRNFWNPSTDFTLPWTPRIGDRYGRHVG